MLRRTAPALAALALIPALAACGADDKPAASATPTSSTGAAATVSVTSTRTSSGSGCGKVPNNAHTQAFLVSGLKVTGGSATFDGPVAAPDDVVSVFYAPGRSSLQQGAVLDGSLPKAAMRAWAQRAPLMGATLEPGRYWLIARVKVDNNARIDTITYPWRTGTTSDTVVDRWHATWDTNC